ncbi:MAG: hypothetical protein ACI31W_02125 [Lactococcus sp.]
MKQKKQRRFLISIAVLLMLLAGAFYSFQQLGNTQSSARSQTNSITSSSSNSNLGIPTTSSTIKAYLKVASSLNSGNAGLKKQSVRASNWWALVLMFMAEGAQTPL